MPRKDQPAGSLDTPHLTAFTVHVNGANTPNAVLDTLQELAQRVMPLNVLGAARLPAKTSDWRSMRIGRNTFLHSSVPTGWWDEYAAMAAREFDPGVMMARSSLMACTWTETMGMLSPVGIDRWPYDLSFKYGMRDALTCSVGRRWLVCYWSAMPLGNVLTQPYRIILFAAASFAALRLEQLVADESYWKGHRSRVTPRELAVLRLASMGRSAKESAKLLRLGEETIRTHLKKAQTKLGVQSRTQAVAEAIRQQLIP